MTTPTTGKYKLAETKRNYPIHLVIRIDPFCIDLVLFPVYQKKTLREFKNIFAS